MQTVLADYLLPDLGRLINEYVHGNPRYNLVIQEFNDLFISDWPSADESYTFAYGTVLLRHCKTEDSVYSIANYSRSSNDNIYNFRKILYKTHVNICKEGLDKDHVITGHKYLV